MTRRALFTWPYAEAEAAAVADKLGAAVAAVLGGGCGYASAGLGAVKLWHQDTAAPKNTDRMYM